MKLHKAAVTEYKNSRSVEMVFIDGADPDDAKEILSFRIQVEREGFPRIAEAQAVALRRARNVIGDEIHRLEEIRGQVFSQEDWYR